MRPRAEASAEAERELPGLERTDPARAESERPEPERTEGERPEGERPEPERPESERAEAERTEPERPESAQLEAPGRERPRFLEAVPDDARLRTLLEAFESGDYARVRREAPALARETSSREVANAALELRRRVDPDPLAVYLLMLGVALFAALVAWTYLGHGH